MYELYGITSSTFSGAYQAWENGLHPDDLIPGRTAIELAIAEKKEFDVEFRVVWPDNSVHHIQGNAFVQRDNTGKAIRMIGTNRDITEQKKHLEIIERNEEKFRSLLEAAPDALVIVNSNGKIQLINQQTEKMFGYSASELIERPVEILIPDNHKAAHPGLRSSFAHSARPREMGEGKELFAKKKNGDQIPVEISLSPLHTPDGFLIIASIRDITNRKKIEQKIKHNEKKFRLMLDTIGDNAWEHNFITGKTTFSSNIQHFMGYGNNELQDNVNLWWQNTHKEDRWMLEENDKNYKAGIIDKHAVEYRINHKDGSTKWILDRGVMIEKKPNGEPLKIIGTHTDITVRKIAQDALAKSEKRFRDLTQNVPGVIYQWHENIDGSFGFDYASPKLKEYFGIDTNDMTMFVSLIHPDDKEKWRSSIEESNKNELPWFFEGRLLYPDGTVKWWQGSAVVSEKSDKEKIYNGFILDLTKEKNTEAELKLQQKRFEGIFNSTYQLIGLVSTDGIMLEANETALKFGDVKPEDIIGKPLWECHWCILNPEVFKKGIDTAAKGDFFQQDVEILGRNNQKAWINFTAKPVFNGHGEVAFIIPEGHDITELLALQTLNKEQEEQIQLFVKHTPAAVAMFDTEIKYIHASDRWYKDYGIDGQDIIGKCHYDVFPEIRDMPEWLAIHQRCLNGAVEIKQEDPFPRADGSTGWLKWEIHPWKKYDGSQGGIIMFTEVITEKVAIRENLIQLNRQLVVSNKELEQFAYVASHDLQEPLRMVSSFMQLLEEKYKPQLDDTARQYIDFAVDGADRMKKLILDLLTFSRIGTEKKLDETVDLNKLIEEIRHSLMMSINECEAQIKIGPLPVIQANRMQMTQLFQNLISNALKYRSDKTPEIEIGHNETDHNYVFYIKDNGIGIDSKYFQKIFVIFQRLHNKTAYSGTGVGLSICKKIVEKHGGIISLQSEPGNGSTFNFTIPKININETRTHLAGRR
jgi:PAS domain S-box-containing protein